MTGDRPEQQAKDEPHGWFDMLEPWLDRFLEVFEFATVSLILGVLVFAVAFEAYWILWAPAQSVHHSRLAEAARTANRNWKLLLVLIVPLFYRGVRGFLERMEEFGKAKAPHKPKVPPVEKTNPIEREARTPEEGDG